MPAESRSYDLVVAGAGPAGSVLAAIEARRGRSVLLCERRELPREKLCGEFLSPDALRALSLLGLDDRAGIRGPAIGRARIAPMRGAVIERALPAPAVGISRAVLDTALRDAAIRAGAEYRGSCRVRSATSGDGTAPPGGPEPGTEGAERSPGLGGAAFLVELQERDAVTRVHARAVADAGGREGIQGAGRSGGASGARAMRAREGLVAFKRHYRPIPGPVRERDPVGAVEIFTFPGGYCGANPIEGDRVNVCFLARASDLRAQAGRPEGVLAWAAEANLALRERMKALEPLDPGFLSVSGLRFGPPPAGSPGSAGGESRPASASRLLRVGDAAGTIAPLCGDGMAMAIGSAVLAADQLESFLTGGQDWGRCLERYRRAWTAEFAGRIRLGSLAQAILVRPGTGGLLLRWGRAFPFAVDWVIRGTRGRIP